MRNVSAPRPGGSLAAIEGAPHADIVMLGHSGFPTGLRELWRLLPERQIVDVRLWLSKPDHVPAARDEQIDWLFERWRVLDSWIDERREA